MDPYELLGVTRSCKPEELKEAFRTKALLVHPDRGGDTAAFIQLRQAYDQIVTEQARRPAGPRSASSVRSARSDRDQHGQDASASEIPTGNRI